MTPEELNLTEPEAQETPLAPLEELVAVSSEEPAAEAEPAVPEEAPAPVPAEKPAKQKGKKPHLALRMLLQLLSLVLSLVLFVTLIASALLLDLRQIISEDGIKTIVNALLLPGQQAPVTVTPAVIEAERLSARLEDSSDPTLPSDFVINGDGTITVGGSEVEIPGDIEVDLGDIPSDILTGGGSADNVMGLVDWVYDQIDASTDEEMPYSKEEMREFIEESTVSEFVSEKLAGFTSDFINGTENTTITAEEVVELLEENQELMKDKLKLELDEEQWMEFKDTVETMVEESQIDTTIRDTVYEAVDDVLEDNSEALGGAELEDIQALLQQLASKKLRNAAIGAPVVLLLLLCLLNYYNVPAGLTWASLPAIFAGLILSAPVYLLQDGAALSALLPAEVAPVVQVVASFSHVLAPIHYGLLFIGLGLLVVSILWRIIRAAVRKHKAA